MSPGRRAAARKGSSPIPNQPEPATGSPVALPALGGVEAVYDVPVTVCAVLGSVTMQVSQLLRLGHGAVLELDRRLGEAVDIYANNRLVARGKLVVMDEARLGVAMTEIVGGGAG